MQTSATATRTEIFIVEDDDSFRDTFCDAMALKGISVEGARSGAEALRVLDGRRPRLIIVDVQLPDVHGFDLIKLLRRSAGLRGVPVVLLSASTRYSDPRDQAEGLEAGAAAFLTKPISMERLWEELGPLLGLG